MSDFTNVEVPQEFGSIDFVKIGLAVLLGFVVLIAISIGVSRNDAHKAQYQSNWIFDYSEIPNYEITKNSVAHNTMMNEIGFLIRVQHSSLDVFNLRKTVCTDSTSSPNGAIVFGCYGFVFQSLEDGDPRRVDYKVVVFDGVGLIQKVSKE